MSLKHLHTLLGAGALALASAAALPLAPAAAQSDADATQQRLEDRAGEVVATFRGERPAGDVFTEDFTAQVPEAAMRAMIERTEGQVGTLVGVESVVPGPQPGSATLTLRFEQALVSGPMQLELAEPWRVSSLVLDKVEPIADAATPVAEQLAALPGTTSLLLAPLDGGAPAIAINEDAQLAIGSTFKLYVLSALVREIAAGRHQWDEVVKLDQRSYPSGILQDWPLGTPMTLQSLATLMISISDNTATDQLIAVLGRDVVEAELVASGHSAPQLDTPFMTTREMFVLKTEGEENLGEYASLGTPERLALLQALQERQVALEQVSEAFAGAPRSIEVEWFASASDIARVLARLRDDPVALAMLGVNTAIGADALAGWDYAGFKGGSEPGVLNMSWLLRDPAGKWYVLSAGWNNPEAGITPARLLGIARSALATVKPAGG